MLAEARRRRDRRRPAPDTVLRPARARPHVLPVGRGSRSGPIGARLPVPGHEPEAARRSTCPTGRSVVPFTSVVTAAGGAGSIATTADDLVHWARALYGGDALEPDDARLDGRRRAADRRATSRDPVRPRRPDGRRSPATRRSATRAASSGARAVVRWLPRERIAIAVLTNQSRTRPEPRSWPACSRSPSTPRPDCIAVPPSPDALPRCAGAPVSRPTGTNVSRHGTEGLLRVGTREPRLRRHPEGTKMAIRVDAYTSRGDGKRDARAAPARCVTRSRTTATLSLDGAAWQGLDDPAARARRVAVDPERRRPRRGRRRRSRHPGPRGLAPDPRRIRPVHGRGRAARRMPGFDPGRALTRPSGEFLLHPRRPAVGARPSRGRASPSATTR